MKENEKQTLNGILDVNDEKTLQDEPKQPTPDNEAQNPIENGELKKPNQTQQQLKTPQSATAKTSIGEDIMFDSAISMTEPPSFPQENTDEEPTQSGFSSVEVGNQESSEAAQSEPTVENENQFKSLPSKKMSAQSSNDNSKF